MAMTTEYTRTYSDIRGIKLGCINDTAHLCDAENVYRDYHSADGAIESVPGFRTVKCFDDHIYGIYRMRSTGENGDRIIVHAGTQLIHFNLSDINDTISPISCGTVKPTYSEGFQCGNYFYVLDGNRIVAMDDSGNSDYIGSTDMPAYVPTTYLEGEKHEQRNLLTDSFIEEYNISNPLLYSYGTSALHYTVTDEEKRICEVSGVDDSFNGTLNIPAWTTINGIGYRVGSIGESAFAGNTGIRTVRISDGVERIGSFAFYKAANLTVVFLPSSLITVGNGAFAECTFLEILYIGSALKSFGATAFSFCTSLSTVNYSGTEEDYKKIENAPSSNGRTIEYGVSDNAIMLRLPIKSSALSLDRMSIDNTDVLFSTEKGEDGNMAAVISMESKDALTGKRIRIYGTANPLYIDPGNGTQIRSFEAVCGCRRHALFDGRLFLAGNPELPNTVFYSALGNSGSNIPFYFGEYDFFSDGNGKATVRAMLTVGDKLAVFKESDDGHGGIFYHEIKYTADDLVPRIYPVASIHSGIGACAGAISFFDDPVFVSKRGISALESEQLNYTRSVGMRSSSINNELLRSNLSNAKLGIWEGYLVIAVDGIVYLGDSRRRYRDIGGSYEYEWFKLCDIGIWEGGTDIYRYSTFSNNHHIVHPTKGDTVCTDTVLHSHLANNELHYTIENGYKYALRKTEEKTGGTFLPATAILADGDLFMFGTANGTLCIFNNDMRGVPPARISESEDFDPAAYKEKMGNRIHPDFYSFCDRAPRYSLKFALDSCDIPYLTKNTVKNSAVIKCKSFASSRLTIEVGTDRSGYSEVTTCTGGDIDFYDIDFSSMDISTSEYSTMPFGEHEKRWVEKQIAIYSDDYCRPIGICSLTYRYTANGRIKRS